MEDVESIVEMLKFSLRHRRGERHREVVAEGVDNDDNGLVKCLRVPATLSRRTWDSETMTVDRRNCTFGLIIQHKPSEEEAFREEVNSAAMNNTALVSICVGLHRKAKMPTHINQQKSIMRST